MTTITIRSAFALTVAALVSSALGSVASAHPNRQATLSAATIDVRGGEFFLRLSTKTLARPGKATFLFKNIGHVLHDFEINGKKTPLIEPGTTAKLVVTFKKKGKYPYLCTVPGHAQAGMKGTFAVR